MIVLDENIFEDQRAQLRARRIGVTSLESPLLKAYGIMSFKGTADEAEHFALDPELLPEESR